MFTTSFLQCTAVPYTYNYQISAEIGQHCFWLIQHMKEGCPTVQVSMTGCRSIENCLTVHNLYTISAL